MNRAKPQILCWQICDAVHLDPSTGKHYLLGCFSNIQVSTFPARHPRMIWFLTLSDVPQGEHQLRILFGPNVAEVEEVVDRKFSSESPLHKINMINEMHNIELPRSGLYAVVIEVNNEPILVTNLGVN